MRIDLFAIVGVSVSLACGGDVIIDAAPESETSPLADAGESPVDAGTFVCGTFTCAGDNYCVEQLSCLEQVYPDGEVVPFPNSYQCQAIPPSCLANPTCDCLNLNLIPGLDQCVVTSGHLMLTLGCV